MPFLFWINSVTKNHMMRVPSASILFLSEIIWFSLIKYNIFLKFTWKEIIILQGFFIYRLQYCSMHMLDMKLNFFIGSNYIGQVLVLSLCHRCKFSATSCTCTQVSQNKCHVSSVTVQNINIVIHVFCCYCMFMRNWEKKDTQEKINKK